MSVTKERCQKAATDAGEVSIRLDEMTGFVSEINNLSTQVTAVLGEVNNQARKTL
ncbi:MAG: methyl-accepting chemotaxis protein [Psychroserpens sp.]|jgi:methyl-accepting chemotaxis protein